MDPHSSNPCCSRVNCNRFFVLFEHCAGQGLVSFCPCSDGWVSKLPYKPKSAI